MAYDAFDPNRSAMIYTRALCERLERCRTSFARGRYGDVERCVARQVLDTDDQFSIAGANVPVDLARACATQMREAPCDVMESALAHCTFTGAVDNGAVCGSDFQCSALLCADTRDLACPYGGEAPVCSPVLRYADAGAPCGHLEGEVIACSASTCVDGVCMAHIKEGGACSLTVQCEAPAPADCAGTCMRQQRSSCK